MTGHLSKGRSKPEETDPLLAAWDIFHLHISNHKANPTDTFFARSGPVMFAHITDSVAYFIDIYPHGKSFPSLGLDNNCSPLWIGLGPTSSIHSAIQKS